MMNKLRVLLDTNVFGFLVDEPDRQNTDFLIVATATIHGLDILVSADEHSMFSDIA